MANAATAGRDLCFYTRRGLLEGVWPVQWTHTPARTERRYRIVEFRNSPPLRYEVGDDTIPARVEGEFRLDLLVWRDEYCAPPSLNCPYTFCSLWAHATHDQGESFIFRANITIHDDWLCERERALRCEFYSDPIHPVVQVPPACLATEVLAWEQRLAGHCDAVTWAIYADWCEEHGWLERAEELRKSVALATPQRKVAMG